MSDETQKQLIRDIAEKTGFPVDDVHALMYGKTPRNYGDRHIKLIQALATDGQGIIIGAIWKGEDDPERLRNSPAYLYLGQLIEGVNLYLYKYGYTSQLFFSNKLLADDAYFEQILSQHPEAGLINFAYLSEHMQRWYERLNRPTVYIDYPSTPDASDQYIVALDNSAVFVEAVQHLYDLGHRRIAFIKSPQHKLSFIDRYRGYCNGLANVGIELDTDLIYDGDWYEPSGEAAARVFLALNSPPTAIIASNDLMAFGAMRVIKESGLRIPEDISIIGFDDVAAAATTTPALTSVHTPLTHLGNKAGEYIVQLLEGETPSPRHTYLPVNLVYRQTTGPAPQHVNERS